MRDFAFELDMWACGFDSKDSCHKQLSLLEVAIEVP